MDTLKKFFPISFKYSDSAANLIIGILIYIVAAAIAGALIGLAAVLTVWIPVLGIILAAIFGLVGSIVEIYVFAGIVIEILVFAKVIK